MAPASWIQRVGAACAAVAIGFALLAPAPSVAVSGRAGDAPARQIGDQAGSARIGVLANPTKHSGESPLVPLSAAVASRVARPPTPGLRFVREGREAPALTRWRIAHGTSTSTP